MNATHTGEPKARRWTADEYYTLLDHGFFNGRRVELIEGDIFEMAAQKNLHAMGITLTQDALRIGFGPGFWIRVQMSLDLTPLSVPDPGIAVVAGAPRTHSVHKNPTSALLVVEVSDTTLVFDRNIKGSLYASAGILDYWILNLVDRQLEVYRNAVADAKQPHGMRYPPAQILGPTDRVSPLAAANASILVADLLP
jgi:Uma2 family endonuclease